MLKPQKSRGRVIIQAYSGHAQPNRIQANLPHYNIMAVTTLVYPTTTITITTATVYNRSGN